MTLTAAQLSIKVTSDTSAAEKGLKAIGDETHKSGGKLGNFLSMFGSFSLANLATNALQQSMGYLTGQISDMIAQGEAANQIQGQTAAVIKSTGDVSGVTAAQVRDLADSMMNQSGISDDATQSAENMLLTFTNIHSNVFPATTKAVADMATAMNGGAIPSQQQMQDTAIQVGKALQDPINGVTALQRVGVKLSDTQKEQVKHFMAVGDQASAQKVILGELNREFGGSAEAAGKANGGLGIMKAKLDEAKQSMGQALLPVVEKMESTALPLITAALGKVSDALNWVSTHSDQLKPVAIALGAVLSVVVVGALGSATVAAWSFTAALLANPATWVALAIVAAIAGIILVVKNWGAITNWLHKTIGTVVTGIKGFFLGLGSHIRSFVGGVVTWFQQLPDKIKQAGIDMIQGFIDGIKSLAGSVANALGGVIHGAVNALPGGTALAHLAGIPGFAGGGITPGGPVIVGEAGPELLIPPAGSRVVPLSGAGRGGSSGGSSGAPIVQHVHVYVAGQHVAEAILPDLTHAIRTGTGLRSW